MLERLTGGSLAMYRTVVDGQGPPSATILFLITPGHLDDFFRLREDADDPSQVAALASRLF